MIDKNNPAGRLYHILDQARSKSDTAKVRTVWAQALSEDEKNDSEITRKVVEVYQLSQEVKKLIEMREGINSEIYLNSFGKINKAIFPLNLNTTWSAQKQQLSPDLMTRLEFCSELLSSFYTEESLSDEDLEKIKTHIEELFQTTLSSSLNDTLRLTLLEEIERLRSAISMYQIKGAKGLKQALQSTLGMVVQHQEDLSEAAKNNQEVLNRLAELLDKLDSFVSKSLKIKKALTKPGRFLLERLTNDDEQVAEEDAVDS